MVPLSGWLAVVIIHPDLDADARGGVDLPTTKGTGRVKSDATPNRSVYLKHN